VTIETLERIGKEIAAADTMCILWAMGVTQHTNASDGSTAISNLLLVTGTICVPAARLSAARPQQRAGASDMGAMPNSYPGYQSVTIRPFANGLRKSGASLFPRNGAWTTIRWWTVSMKESCARLSGWRDMISADSNANYVGAAFEKLDLFVVQDISSPKPAATLTWFARCSSPRKGRHVYQYRARVQRLYQALQS